jgi:hypothetical protein
MHKIYTTEFIKITCIQASSFQNFVSVWNLWHWFGWTQSNHRKLCKQFYLVYNNTHSGVSCTTKTFFVAFSSVTISLFSDTDFDIWKVIKWPLAYKSDEVYGIPGFTVMGCIDIFVPFLQYILNLSYLQDCSHYCGSKLLLCQLKKKNALVHLLATVTLFLSTVISSKFVNLW